MRLVYALVISSFQVFTLRLTDTLCLLFDFTRYYLRQRRMKMHLPAFVCLSVSKITQKRVHGFG